MCQTLFAVNGVYLLNEKGAVAAVDGFASKPADFGTRVAAVYADLGSGAHAAALARLETLVSETAAL